MIQIARKFRFVQKVSILLAIAVALIAQPIGVIFVQNQQASAAPWGWYQGYFYGGRFTSQRWNVINDGVPTWITTKQQLIDFTIGKLYGAPLDVPGNLASMDATGAAYIIQTMRGGTDHSIPDGSDINDWIARINNPDIYLEWGWYAAGINSARMNYSSPHRDTSAYVGDGVAYYSLLLKSASRGGQIMYVLKQLCANPLGGLMLPDPVNYSLEPTINASPDSTEGGSQATLTPTITNNGLTGSSSAQWQVTTFSVAPSGSIPGGPATNGTLPVNHYGNSASVVASGSQAFNRGNNVIPVASQTVGDFAVGTRVCYTLSIQPYRHDNGNWRHSLPDCVTIAKKPKVQVLGGDLIVGKGQTSTIVTSSTTKSFGGTNRTFGSWGEYGVIASGQVTSMASGAGYSGGAPSNVFCGVSLLTFSNVNAGQTSCTSASQMGGYANSGALPDSGSRLSATSSLGNNPTVNISSTATGSYSGTGTITLNSTAPIARGEWVVINAPTATVNITSNINYTNGVLQSLDDIPQIVIIANQIRIAGSVTNIDAWLIANGATGNLITCSDVASANQLTSSNCDQTLTVNGPVVAKHLYLYRTAGAGTGAQTGDPAEVFNLRPDAYLWATGYSAEAGRLQTVTTKELPPRF